MSRSIASFALVLATLAAPALAQETPGPGRAEVTVIPGGAVFFTDTSDASDSGEPSFGNYDLGGAFAVNFGRASLEAEVAGSLGISQNLQFGGALPAKLKTPNMLSYTGNLVVPLVAGRQSVVPYATAGIGGLTLFERQEVGIDGTDTFFTANVGGGLKWYVNNRWGLRGDYRFVTVASKNDAPSFFGQDRRYGHRIYGGLVLNVAR
jgi:opacity protein-like surface antigen